MSGRSVALALVVAVSVVGAAFAAGAVPAFGDEGGDVESFPTATPDAGGGDSASGSDPASPPFTFAIERVRKCGETCRDVTTTLTNEQADPASDVTVYTRIYAGNGTDGEVVWEGRERVGDLEANGSYTATERVDLSMADALAVEQNDGQITVQTTVQSANETVTFTRQRDVA